MATNSAEYMRNYRRTSAYKERHAHSEKTKARKRRYNKSEKGKAADARKTEANKRTAKLIIAEAKSHPCIDCGGNFPPICMDFHHLRDKKYTVGRSWHRGLKSLMSEIAKCVVICANCHRLRHQRK